MARARSRNVPAQSNRSTVSVQRTVSASFEGPIPPPVLLEQYNELIPNGAERILAMAESNSQHRQTLESFALRSEHQRSMLGIIAGLLVALALGGAGLWSTLAGHEPFGLAIIGIDMVGLVGTFVYGTESRRRERLQRAEIMTGRRQVR